MFAAIAILGPTVARAQNSVSDTTIAFSIPSQPLSRALVAYSAATGLEIFYKAALAEGYQSTTVVGRLKPGEALQELLRGTGYFAKATGLGAFTIMPAMRESVPISDTARRLYEPYFATIQARITDILCRNASLASNSAEMLFQVWLAPSGAVARTETLNDDGSQATDQTFAAAMRGLIIGAPPPEGMPQPISMVVFPHTNTSRDCRAADHRRGAR